MLVLLAIGFVAGIVTALSPCVLPVLPIVLAGGATGRRPLAIIAGIVLSITVFTLFAAWLRPYYEEGPPPIGSPGRCRLSPDAAAATPAAASSSASRSGSSSFRARDLCSLR